MRILNILKRLILPSKKKQYKRMTSPISVKKGLAKGYSRNVEYYETTRAFYERGYGGQRERKLISLFCRGSIVLDVACGTGRLLPFLVESGFLVVGNDIAPGMLKVAKRKESNARLVIADAEQLPFQKRVFDNVLCSRAFKMFPNPISALSEAKRCLRNGIIGLSIETRELLWVRVVVRLGLLSDGDFKYRVKDVEDFFEKSRMKIIEKRCIIYFGRDLYTLLGRSSHFNRFLRMFDNHMRHGRNVMFVGKPIKDTITQANK